MEDWMMTYLNEEEKLMMKYEEFKEKMITQLKEWVSMEFPGKEIRFETVYKINQVFDGIFFTIEEKAGYVKLIMYLDELYSVYLETNNFSNLFLYVANVIKESADNIGPMEVQEILNMVSDKDKVVYQLINTEQNQELLKTIPHRDFLDLSVIYRYVFSMDETDRRICSTIITNASAEILGVNEQELFDLAKVNTKRLFTTTIKPISQVLERKDSADNEMHIVTNSIKWYGAATILDEEVLHKLAEKLGSDLILFFTSLDEFVAYSASIITVDEADILVQSIIQKKVAIKDRLSNHAYYYNRELRTITFNTDKTYGRLDDDLFKQ